MQRKGCGKHNNENSLMSTYNSDASACQLFLVRMLYLCTFTCVAVTRYYIFTLISKTSKCHLLSKLGVTLLLSFLLGIIHLALFYNTLLKSCIHIMLASHDTLGKYQDHIPNFHGGQHLKITPFKKKKKETTL